MGSMTTGWVLRSTTSAVFRTSWCKNCGLACLPKRQIAPEKYQSEL